MAFGASHNQGYARVYPLIKGFEKGKNVCFSMEYLFKISIFKLVNKWSILCCFYSKYLQTLRRMAYIPVLKFSVLHRQE